MERDDGRDEGLEPSCAATAAAALGRKPLPTSGRAKRVVPVTWVAAQECAFHLGSDFCIFDFPRARRHAAADAWRQANAAEHRDCGPGLHVRPAPAQPLQPAEPVAKRLGGAHRHAFPAGTAGRRRRGLGLLGWVRGKGVDSLFHLYSPYTPVGP